MPHKEVLSIAPLNELIPEVVYELAKDRQKVRIATRRDDKSHLSIYIYEQGASTGTDSTSWEQYLQKIKEDRAAKIWVTPPPNEGVDQFHALLREVIERQKLTIHDQIMMICKLSVVESDLAVLSVDKFDAPRGKKIARDFYTKTLPSLAKKMGFRFIVGINDQSNIWFFRERLGRSLFSEIKQEYRNYFFPEISFTPTANAVGTVQFLFEEDKPEYLRISIGESTEYSKQS